MKTYQVTVRISAFRAKQRNIAIRANETDAILFQVNVISKKAPSIKQLIKSYPAQKENFGEYVFITVIN